MTADLVLSGGSQPMLGVIIDCPQKDLFHDLVNIILTSRTVISNIKIRYNVYPVNTTYNSEIVDDYNDNKWPLGKIK